MCANRRADFAAGRRGFTLIELLVVIAIIALLVSILMPMLKQAGEMAQSSACQTNMHSLSNAFHMYASEWDDKLPDDYAYYKNASNPRRVYGLQFWPIIYQYLTDHPERKEGNLGFVHGLRNKVGYLACPSLGEQGGGWWWGWGHTDYTFVYTKSSVAAGTNWRKEVQAAEFRLGRLPRTHAMLAERDDRSGDGCTWGWPTTVSTALLLIRGRGVFPYNSGQFAPGVGSHHMDGSNMMFPDGSVKHAKRSQYYPDPDDLDDIVLDRTLQ